MPKIYLILSQKKQKILKKRYYEWMLYCFGKKSMKINPTNQTTIIEKKFYRIESYKFLTQIL
jgi:hypothetical protein